MSYRMGCGGDCAGCTKRSRCPDGLGYSLSDFWTLAKNMLDPWSYQQSVPQPGTSATTSAQVYTTLNKLISIIQDGLARARGNAALTEQGAALNAELVQFYTKAGQDIEWAKARIGDFATRVYRWSNAVGMASAGGAKAFEQAQRGSSPVYQSGQVLSEFGGTIAESAGLPASSGKWVLPIGAGLVLLLLLRR